MSRKGKAAESSLRPDFLVGILFLVALSTLVYALIIGSEHPAARRGEMAYVAENLALHGEFADPFPLRQTGATAAVAPGYAFFMAMLLKVFGQERGGTVIVVVAALVHGIHAVLLILLSREVLDDHRPGVWAALLVGLLPTIRFMPAWEAVFAATGLMGFCLVSMHWMQRDRVSRKKVLLLGMMVGALALLHPAAALIAVLWMALLFRNGWKDLQNRVVLVACFGLTMLTVPLPWAIRNRIVLGMPVIKDGLGWALNASNNDCASSSFVSNFRSGCEHRFHPYGNRAEADLLAAVGEARYDTYRLNTAKAWIRVHPAAFFRLTAMRVLEFWFPNMSEAPYAYTISAITIMCLAGFVLMAGRHETFLQYAIVASLVYPMTYYVIVSDSRYRVPILWISLLGAGYFLQVVWERFQSSRAIRGN